jgi:hypothetical protein
MLAVRISLNAGRRELQPSWCSVIVARGPADFVWWTLPNLKVLTVANRHELLGLFRPLGFNMQCSRWWHVTIFLTVGLATWRGVSKPFVSISLK